MAIVLDFIRDSIQQQHEAWDKAISDLTPDQMRFRLVQRAGQRVGR